MECFHCYKNNRAGSRFCRFCGAKLGRAEGSKRGSALLLLRERFIISSPKLLRSKKALVILVALIILGSGSAFAAPKVSDYVAVNKLLQEAREFQEEGNYKGALTALVAADKKWTLRGKKDEIAELQKKQKQYIKDKDALKLATEQMESGELEEARETLKSISTKFPEYKAVKDKLSEVQVAIEERLQEEVRRAEEARRLAAQKAQQEAAAKARAEAKRKAAEQRARKEAEERARAEEQARAKEQERKRAQAQAEAEAEARARAQREAEEAERRRQQEALERHRQVRISFCNQLVTITTSFGEGVDYYNIGMDHYNNLEDLSALARFGQAEAILQKVKSDASALKSNFSNLPSKYYNGASDLSSAANYLLKAIDAMAGDISSGITSGLANSYSSTAEQYSDQVTSFLFSECNQ